MKVVPPMWSFGRPQIRALVSVSNVDRRAARLAFLGSCFPEVIRNRYGNVMSPCDSEKSEIQPNLASGRQCRPPAFHSGPLLLSYVAHGSRGPVIVGATPVALLRSIGVVELASIGRMVQQR